MNVTQMRMDIEWLEMNADPEEISNIGDRGMSELDAAIFIEVFCAMTEAYTDRPEYSEHEPVAWDRHQQGVNL